MSSTPKNFVADKDTILKEGWFKKRNFKGELGRGYSKRWCVLTNRYFEWFDCPVRPEMWNYFFKQSHGIMFVSHSKLPNKLAGRNVFMKLYVQST